MERIDGWSVVVEVNGETVLTISDKHVAGISDIDKYGHVVRGAGHNLLSFIGNRREAAAALAPEPVAFARRVREFYLGFMGKKIPGALVEEVRDVDVALVAKWCVPPPVTPEGGTPRLTRETLKRLRQFGDTGTRHTLTEEQRARAYCDCCNKPFLSVIHFGGFAICDGCWASVQVIGEAPTPKGTHFTPQGKTPETAIPAGVECPPIGADWRAEWFKLSTERNGLRQRLAEVEQLNRTWTDFSVRLVQAERRAEQAEAKLAEVERDRDQAIAHAKDANDLASRFKQKAEQAEAARAAAVNEALESAATVCEQYMGPIETYNPGYREWMLAAQKIRALKEGTT